MKPILFNTEMVQAILQDRKTVTRRLVKKKYSNTHLEIFTNKYGTRLIELQNDVEGETHGENADGTSWHKLLGMREVEYDHKPYNVGDILYVRETWGFDKNNYIYKSDYTKSDIEKLKNIIKWRPSIHMPKEATRIFLRVTNVRVELLKDITEEQAIKEGTPYELCGAWKPTFNDPDSGGEDPDFTKGFSKLWDTTINKLDIDYYGWDVNPWVWVIEFERIEKENL